MPLRVVAIVEGHGEDGAIRHLLERIRYDLPPDLPKQQDPEGEGLGKAWIKKHLPRKYKETVDQPRFVGHMSLTECQASSRSFRKLVKELEQRLPGQE